MTEVGRTAVTHVLNGTGGNVRVSPIKAARIRRVADRLGYKPNAMARAMATRRFGSVALVMSTTRIRSHLPSTLLYGVAENLVKQNLRLTIEPVADDKLTDPKFIPLILRQWCCDGLLINYTDHMPPRMTQLLEEAGHPSVWMNADRPHDTVRLDDFHAGQLATEHLLELGHRHIAFHDANWNVSQATGTRHYSKEHRYQGYVQAMTQAGLTGQLICDDPPQSDELWAVHLSQLLARPDRPTAIVAADPRMVERAALLAGLNIPRDLSILTFLDQIQESAVTRYSAAVALYGRVGRAAVEMLCQKMATPHRNFPTQTIDFKFENGYSSAPPNG